MTTTIELTRELIKEIDDIFDEHWQVIVFNDDITTFDTVITALIRIFRHERDVAEALAWKVHREGRAVVAVQAKDEAESSVKKLHGYKIQATCERL